MEHQPDGLVSDTLMKEFSNSASESDNVSGSFQISSATLGFGYPKGMKGPVLATVVDSLSLRSSSRLDMDAGYTEKLLCSAKGEGTAELGIALKVRSTGVWADFVSPTNVYKVVRELALLGLFDLGIPSIVKLRFKKIEVIKQSEDPVATPHYLTITVVGKRTQVGEPLTFVR